VGSELLRVCVAFLVTVVLLSLSTVKHVHAEASDVVNPVAAALRDRGQAKG
jgi:hypothetical protein